MEDFVPTRASQTKGNIMNNYISVNYEVPKKRSRSTDNLDNEKKQKNHSIDSKTKKDTSAELRKQQEKEMKRARYDVIKFGMSGFEKGKARRAKVELAISLGAIPPKNRRRNYKVLKARRKMENEKKKEECASGFSSSLLKPKSKKVHKKDSLKSRRKTEEKKEHISGFTSSLLKSKSKKRHKKDSGILGAYGKVSKNL